MLHNSTEIQSLRKGKQITSHLLLPKLFASKHFLYPGQKGGIQAQQKPNQKLNYEFQKAKAALISGAFFCLFLKYSWLYNIMLVSSVQQWLNVFTDYTSYKVAY